MWLSSAIRLFEAAEVIFRSQESIRIEYERALEAAIEEAERNGKADIWSDEPNFQPAQLLCGFAIENALKGIIVANEPDRISEERLDRDLQNHDLTVLARLARFSLSSDDEHVCRLLTDIVLWAGRYPVATRAERQMKGASDQLIDWEDLPNLRSLGRKLIDTLQSRLDHPLPRYGMMISLSKVDEDADNEDEKES